MNFHKVWRKIFVKQKLSGLNLNFDLFLEIFLEVQ